MSEPWLGHWDGCSIQWSDFCDCDPDNPIDSAQCQDAGGCPGLDRCSDPDCEASV